MPDESNKPETPTKLPHPWLEYLASERHNVKKAPLFFIICILVSGGIVFAYFKTCALPNKDLVIQAKDATIQQKDASIQQLQIQVSVLSGSPSMSPASVSETKKLGLILVSQLIDFSKKDRPEKRMAFTSYFEHKYSDRIMKMRESLDELGQTSPDLDRLLGVGEMDSVYMGNIDSNFVFQVAEDLKETIGKLK